MNHTSFCPHGPQLFRATIMTKQYIYRYDDTGNLRAIQDNCHRARRWDGSPTSYPHKLLRARIAKLSNTQAIYRICFWVNLQDVIDETDKLKRVTPDKLITLTRCSISDVLSESFQSSWDDGFKEGKAYLFWKEEDLENSNSSFSKASIPFSKFEALVDGSWLPLSSHLSPAVPPTPAIQTSGKSKKNLTTNLLRRIKKIFLKK